MGEIYPTQCYKFMDVPVFYFLFSSGSEVTVHVLQWQACYIVEMEEQYNILVGLNAFLI